MTGEPTLTIVGNLTDDPELRFGSSGTAVATIVVASTPRSLDKQTQQWQDGTTLFMRCVCFRETAEHVAETLQKGMRVVVTGRLEAQEWNDKQTGEKRRGQQLLIDEVGPSLRYATAKVVKAQRQDQGQQGGGWGQQQPQGGQWGGNSGQPDPWSTSGGNAPQGGGQGWDGAPPANQGQQWGGGQPQQGGAWGQPGPGPEPAF